MTNLIVIVADTLRDLNREAPPQESLRTPFLAALRARGCSFTHLIASSPWTIPSHASLLSGIDPWKIGFIPERRLQLIPDARSLADDVRDAGGLNLLFSANALVSPGSKTAPGYDEYNPGYRPRTRAAPIIHASLHGAAAIVESFERSRPLWPPTADRPDEPAAPRRPSRLLRSLSTEYHRWATAIYSGAALNRILSRRLRTIERRRPLHLMINLMEAHEPHFPDRPAPADEEGRSFPAINLAYHSKHLGARPGNANAVRSSYMESTRRLDAAVREIHETLRRHDVLHDAWLLFVSDHGQSLGENGYFGHGRVLYDELVRIPGFLVRYRGGTPQPLPPEFSDWVDHRHLFDFLVASVREASDPPVEPTLATSLAARGPAASYYEGTPTDCRDLLRSGARFQSIRVWKGDDICAFTDQNPSRSIEPIALLGSRDAQSTEIADVATGILAREQADPTRGLSLDVEVDERLKSWGYV